VINPTINIKLNNLFLSIIKRFHNKVTKRHIREKNPNLIENPGVFRTRVTCGKINIEYIGDSGVISDPNRLTKMFAPKRLLKKLLLYDVWLAEELMKGGGLEAQVAGGGVLEEHVHPVRADA
jgi:hypothetical protein